MTNDLNRKSHRVIAWATCFCFVLFVTALFSVYSLNWYTLGISVLALILAITVLVLVRNLADLSVKEGMMLVHRNRKPCQITELKTLRRLQNWVVFNTNISKISYKLDGKNFEAWTLWKEKNLPSTDEARFFVERMQSK